MAKKMIAKNARNSGGPKVRFTRRAHPSIKIRVASKPVKIGMTTHMLNPKQAKVVDKVKNSMTQH